MTLDELYSYWDDSHQELVEAVEGLKEWQLESVPGPGGRSLHEILLGFLRAERYWVGHLVAGFPEYRPQAHEFPDGPSLAEALKANRAVSAQVLAPFGVDGLRAVRTVPGDPATNRYETNRPVGWLFWQVLEQELVCRGQILQRLEDEKARG